MKIVRAAVGSSHCLFTIFVEGRKQGSDTVRRAKLHMVDLAGSERAHKTGATGQTLREATYINQSLFFLEMVRRCPSISPFCVGRIPSEWVVFLLERCGVIKKRAPFPT